MFIYFFLAIILAIVIIPLILLLNYSTGKKKRQNRAIAEQHYQKALVYMEKKLYEECKKNLRIALKYDPSNDKYRVAIKKLNKEGHFVNKKVSSDKKNVRREIKSTGVEIKEISNVISKIKRRQKLSNDFNKVSEKRKFNAKDIRIVNELYKEAERLYQSQKYSLALPLYQQITRDYPGSDKEILIQNRLIEVINYLKKDIH